MDIIFATNNPHKQEEAQVILGPSFHVLTPASLGYPGDLPETCDTLRGNSVQKACAVWNLFQTDCFADDTGLEVEALGGAPGVYSARYAGEHCSYQDNVAKMLAAMKGEKNRKAAFRTVIALNLDGQSYFFEGRCDGQIIEEQRGTDGFGYDPIFLPDGFEETFAEMGHKAKNAISHRGRATRKLIAFLKELN